jgi:Ran GTPase-activating protein (RanGAP) involved in mRNA processing and transport
MLPALVALDLSGNHIGDAGARALAASPHMAHITTLNLSGNKIGPEGAAALAASPTLNETIRDWWRRPSGESDDDYDA